ncbi:MAG TPA: ABC transporter substrate-binding protein [Devosia sp.]|nr:ABC transporter substrate-binding protein [Devosia sp.]
MDHEVQQVPDRAAGRMNREGVPDPFQGGPRSIDNRVAQIRSNVDRTRSAAAEEAVAVMRDHREHHGEVAEPTTLIREDYPMKVDDTGLGRRFRRPPMTLEEATIDLKRRALLKMGLASAALPVFGPLAGLITGAQAQENTGQELRVAVSDFVDERFDPRTTTTVLNEVMCAVFEVPIQIDENGRPAPGIVSGWEVSPDGQDWTLHVRDDVVFHDGTKVTADDVAFAYQRSVQDDTFTHDLWRSILGETPQIEVPDATTVKIRTNGPQPFFVELSTEYGAAIWIVPKAYVEANGVEHFQTNPIGTGPYRFVEHARGNYITMQAVDYKHWRVNGQFAKITLLLVPEEITRVQMLRAGEVDEIPLSADNAKPLAAEGYTIWHGVSQQTYLATIGAYREEGKSSPLSSLNVRHALSLAINRQEIVDTMFGADIASVPTLPMRIGKAMPDMTDALREKWGAWAKDAYRYDPDEAKRLLEEAGYGNGLTFDYWSVPDSGAPYHHDLGQVIVSYWQRVGVNAVISIVDQGVWKAARNSRASPDAIGKMGIQTGSLDKLSTVENLNPFSSFSGTVDHLAGAPQEPEYDVAWQTGMSTMDPKVREEVLDKMITIATESWTAIPILETSALFAFGPRVEPILPRPTVNLGYYYASWKYKG